MTSNASTVQTPPRSSSNQTARPTVDDPLSSGEGVDSATRAHRMPYGAQVERDGTVRFQVWAPTHKHVGLDLGSGPLPMTLLEGGWHQLITRDIEPGALYRFVLPDGSRIPDPASRFQPEDVHGPSQVIDPAAYEWQQPSWRGRPWHECVLYELHIGAFTPEGTFRAAISRLDHLVSLGVTAIEIMPVADFPGARNWGYDGVLPYAPDSRYGRPEDFKALVDAAHGLGLMVLLDVVYNHFGPEGNYMPSCAPPVLTERHQTPWGDAINYDGPDSVAVREFVIHNALYWIEEFYLDGLRLDAVHAILDESPKHLLVELAERVRALGSDRCVHLLLENEDNGAGLLVRDDSARPLLYSAQWNDDAHHVLHTAATGEANGYYSDYHGDTLKLGRALAEGFAFQGEHMPFRGSARGEASAQLPPVAFVAFIQNHDQVGNRAFGERMGQLVPEQVVRAVASVYLLLPQIPMIFMGEEWNAAQPFPFFCDFGDELAAAVREGRRKEFARFPEFQDPERREQIPDPQAPSTFEAAILAWEALTREPHASHLRWYRDLLRVRHEALMPRLPEILTGGTFEVVAAGAVIVRWQLAQHTLVLSANLSAASVRFPPQHGRVLWLHGAISSGCELSPWSVRWALATADHSSNDEETNLNRLANYCGIEPEFTDVRGELRKTTKDTQQKLLRALGLDGDSEDAAGRTLEQLQTTQWRQPLPPVHVAYRARGPIAIPLSFPQHATDSSWRIQLESGSELRGGIEFRELPLISTRTVEGHLRERRRLLIRDDIEPGYHTFTTEPSGASMLLIVTPGQCWLPAAAEGQNRLWGVAAQLYLLRSDRNWGIGDYSDLGEIMGHVHRSGGDVVGVNPLHAMFLDNPEHASPYSPASRLMLNALNIDVAAVEGFRDSPEVQSIVNSDGFRSELDECRQARYIQYRRVAELKMPVLRALFAHARSQAGERWKDFLDFRNSRGEQFARGWVFQALRHHFAALNPAHAAWQHWPAPFQDYRSDSVADFTQRHAEEVNWFAWLEWTADQQLTEAARAGSGMQVGLYRDLAVGADEGGAEVWSNPNGFVRSARVGAPPDLFNKDGQDWGLPAFHPRALQQCRYAEFIDLLRANMRHAGALRIDHVMALQHLYLIPEGEPAVNGAYVRYPFEDLIGILALESQRHRCLIVGEDLGSVPEGFRERMAQACVLSYRVLTFERREDGAFLPPQSYPPLALAVFGNHDLPTLRGWWEGTDIDIKERMQQFASEAEAAAARSQRRDDRRQLLDALASERLLESEREPDFELLLSAVHAYLGRTRSLLAMAQMDDLAAEADPVNLPNTSTEYPNWRRRLGLSLRALAGRPALTQVANALRETRANEKEAAALAQGRKS